MRSTPGAMEASTMRPVLALPLLAISLSMLAATAIPEVHAQDASRNDYPQAKVANF